MAPGTPVRLLHATVILFFGLVFLRFAHPLVDGDLWWHLNTGRWIVGHGALPTADPFTFTVSPEFTERARMFVRSNWLAQVIYYTVFSAGGLEALRYFNAALFTGAALAVYRLCRRGGLVASWALVFTGPFVALSWHYDELRPFGFSVLFTAIVLLQLDRAETEDATPGPALAPLILVAVLWANLHRGFALFYLLLVPWTLIWAIRGRFRHAGWLIAAGLATLLNPGGVQPVVSAVEEAFQGSASFQIMELAKPWEFAALAPFAGSYLPLAGLLLAASLAVVLLAGRRFPKALIATWVLFAIAGLTAFRYTIYFGIVATFVAARGAAWALARTKNQLDRTGVACALMVSLALAATTAPWPSDPVSSTGLPQGAVDVLLENSLPAPVLNTFDWGGYIAWRTGSAYRVFTDSRMLDFALMRKMQRVGGEHPLLEEYAINTVIWPALDHGSMRVPRLVLELLTDPQWTLVYYDRIAVVFVRSEVAPSTPRASASALAQALLDVVRYRATARGWTTEDRQAASVLEAVLAGIPAVQESDRRW